MIDLLYVSFNRFRYTQESFEALLTNTDWTLVNRLFIADDASTDGTADYLENAATRVPTEVVWNHGRFGGPVAAMNWLLDHPDDICGACDGEGHFDPEVPGDLPQVCRACDGRGTTRHPDVFGKIDNDFVVCPGWLNMLWKTLQLHPEVDVLGTEPWYGSPTMPSPHSAFSVGPPVEHVGGKGLIRRRIFSRCRPQPGGFNGYQGWTQYQAFHPDIVKVWITPDLPCFGLDQVRDEDGPWRALAHEYEALGWGRLWPCYGSNEHYSWWKPVG